MDIISLKKHENLMKELLKKVEMTELANNFLDITCQKINRRK